MGKILVIKGADFSTVAVENLFIDLLDDYVQSTTIIESEEYKKVLVDANYRILYGIKSDNTVEDYTNDVLGFTFSDGTQVTTLIHAYKKIN